MVNHPKTNRENNEDIKVTIKPITDQSDINSLPHLQEKIWKHGDINNVPDHLLTVFKKGFGGLILGAYNTKNELIGFRLVLTKGNVHYCHMMGVMDEHQKKGVGKQLLQAHIDLAKEKKVDYIVGYGHWSGGTPWNYIKNYGGLLHQYEENMYGEFKIKGKKVSTNRVGVMIAVNDKNREAKKNKYSEEFVEEHLFGKELDKDTYFLKIPEEQEEKEAKGFEVDLQSLLKFGFVGYETYENKKGRYYVFRKKSSLEGDGRIVKIEKKELKTLQMELNTAATLASSWEKKHIKLRKKAKRIKIFTAVSLLTLLSLSGYLFDQKSSAQKISTIKSNEALEKIIVPCTLGSKIEDGHFFSYDTIDFNFYTEPFVSQEEKLRNLASHLGGKFYHIFFDPAQKTERRRNIFSAYIESNLSTLFEKIRTCANYQDFNSTFDVPKCDMDTLEKHKNQIVKDFVIELGSGLQYDWNFRETGIPFFYEDRFFRVDIPYNWSRWGLTYKEDRDNRKLFLYKVAEKISQKFYCKYVDPLKSHEPDIADQHIQKLQKQILNNLPLLENIINSKGEDFLNDSHSLFSELESTAIKSRNKIHGKNKNK